MDRCSRSSAIRTCERPSPRRWPSPIASMPASTALDLVRRGALDFSTRPTTRAFRASGSRADALDAGGTAPAVLNAANEVAVAAFLAGRIRYTDIAPACAEALARLPARPVHALDDALAADAEARAVDAGLAEASRWPPDGRHDQARRVPRRAGRPRRLPRARSLLRGALVQGQGAALLHRLRPHRVVAPVRTRPHRVGGFRDSARRLREDGRRARRRGCRGRPAARIQPAERRASASRSSPPGPSRTCCSRCCCLPARTSPAFPRSARCWPRLPRIHPRRSAGIREGDLVVAVDGVRGAGAGRICAGACCARRARRDITIDVERPDGARAAAHGVAGVAQRRRLGRQFHADARLSQRSRPAADRRSAARQARARAPDFAPATGSSRSTARPCARRPKSRRRRTPGPAPR